MFHNLNMDYHINKKVDMLSPARTRYQGMEQRVEIRMTSTSKRYFKAPTKGPDFCSNVATHLAGSAKKLLQNYVIFTWPVLDKHTYKFFWKLDPYLIN